MKKTTLITLFLLTGTWINVFSQTVITELINVDYDIFDLFVILTILILLICYVREYRLLEKKIKQLDKQIYITKKFVFSFITLLSNYKD